MVKVSEKTCDVKADERLILWETPHFVTIDPEQLTNKPRFRGRVEPESVPQAGIDGSSADAVHVIPPPTWTEP